MSWTKLLLLVVLTASAVALFIFFQHHGSLEALAKEEQTLRKFAEEHPLRTQAAAFGLYYLLSSLAIPGTWTLAVVYGWLFGFWTATIGVSFAATAGAETSMLLGRYLFRDYVTAHLGHRMHAAELELDRHGAQYVVLLRFLWMIPAMIVNFVMALTSVGAWTFWWATQVGLLPGIMLHTFTGAQLPHLDELAKEGFWRLISPGLIAAFAALAIVPLIIKGIAIWWERRKARSTREVDPGV